MFNTKAKLSKVILFCTFIAFNFCIPGWLSGQNFNTHIFKTEQGLSHNHVKKIYLSNDNRLILHTSSGVDVFNGHDISNLGITEDSKSILALLVDQNNLLWVLPVNSKMDDIILYDLNRMESVDTEMFFAEDYILFKDIRIYNIDNNKNKNKIKLYTDKGVYKYNGKKFLESEIACEDFHLLNIESKCSINLDKKFIEETQLDISSLNFLNDFYTSDSLVIAMSEKEVLQFEAEEDKFLIDTISLRNVLGFGQITDIICLGKNSYWVASSNGLIKISPSKFDFNYHLEGYSTREMYEINEDSILIVGYGGLLLFNTRNKNVKVISGEYDFFGIEKLTELEFLITSESTQLFKYNLSKPDELEFLNPFPKKGPTTTDAIRVNDSIAYIATYFGLYEYNYIKEDFRLKDFINGQISDHIFSFNRDQKDSTILVCHSKGIYKIDIQKDKYQSIPLNKTYDVTFIYRDKSFPNILWIGTRKNGLIYFDELESRGRSLMIKDGLSNESVHGIYEDESNRLWVSTDFGINCINKKTEEITQYYVDAEDLVNEFNRSSSIQLEDGSIIFGSINGIVHFDPNVTERESGYLNSSVLKYQYYDIVSGRISDLYINKDTYSIQIPRRYKELKIYFEKDLLSSGSIYRYKIPEIADKWKFTSTGIAELKYLIPQKYSFVYSKKVRGNEWTESKTMLINVERSLYSKSWFWLALSSILFLLYYLYTQNRTKKLIRLNQTIEQKVEENTIELRQKNNQLNLMNETNEILFNILSHDLRAPLISMSKLSSLMKDIVGEEDQKMSKIGKTLEHRSKKMLEMIDYLLEWAKVQRHVGTKKIKSRSIKTIIKKVENELLEDQQEKRIDVVCLGDSDIIVEVDEVAAMIIVRNVLQNAIKFSLPDSKIALTLNQINCRLSIEDKAGGIPEYILDKLLNPQGSGKIASSHKDVGLGMGLQITKYLIKTIGGRIEFDVRKGIGTVIHIYFK